MGGLAGMFSSPDFLAKLATNPETRHLVGDQGFMAKLQMMQSNPSNMGMFLQDPDIMKVRQQCFTLEELCCGVKGAIGKGKEGRGGSRRHSHHGKQEEGGRGGKGRG